MDAPSATKKEKLFSIRSYNSRISKEDIINMWNSDVEYCWWSVTSSYYNSIGNLGMGLSNWNDLNLPDREAAAKYIMTNHQLGTPAVAVSYTSMCDSKKVWLIGGWVN